MFTCWCFFKGFPLWCMTWPRPHPDLSRATTTEEHPRFMPLVSPNTACSSNVWEFCYTQHPRTHHSVPRTPAAAACKAKRRVLRFQHLWIKDLKTNVARKQTRIPFCPLFCQFPVPKSRGRKASLGLPFMWRWQQRGNHGALRSPTTPPVLNGMRVSLCKEEYFAYFMLWQCLWMCDRVLASLSSATGSQHKVLVISDSPSVWWKLFTGQIVLETSLNK